MVEWIVVWRKNDTHNDKPTKLQINKVTVSYIEKFDDRIVLHFVNQQQLILFLNEWEISF